MNLTVVIPTYNEAENLPRIIPALFGLPIADLHVLIVDDNSPDGSGELAEQLRLDYPDRIQVMHRSGKLGLGSAYIMGFRHALQQGSQAVAQMDADFSHPPEKLVPMATALDEADLVIGSRYVKGGSLDERWPFWRKFLSAFGNIYARTILGVPVRDVTGGFRIWRREVLLRAPLDRVRSNGYSFQVEMAYIATCLGCRITELPIYFADRRWGQSKMSFRIQREAAVQVWQLRQRYRDLPPVFGNLAEA